MYHEKLEFIKSLKEKNLEKGNDWLLDTWEYEKYSKGLYDNYDSTV